MLRYCNNGECKWKPGSVTSKCGHLYKDVQVDDRTPQRHFDELRKI